MENQTTRLAINDKITLLAEHIPHFYSFSLGLFINAGSRDETYEESGITHLVEHMLFKGTQRQTSFEIMKRIEALGGSFDAFTTKENVVILTRFLSEHLIEIFDLISEILLESTFDAEGLEREKNVVLEELKSQFDDPEDYVFELLFDAIFAPSAFGYPISGREESLKLINREKITDFYKKFLSPRFVVAIAGRFELDSLVSRINDGIRNLPYASVPRKNPAVNRSVFRVQKRQEISQVYVALGMGGPPYKDMRRFPLALLNSAFGGSMSSRLFQSMREKEGRV